MKQKHNLFYFKQFYLVYPNLIAAKEILHSARGESSRRLPSGKLHALRGEWNDMISLPLPVIPQAAPAISGGAK